MRRLVLALCAAAAAIAISATPAVACPTCFDPRISLQTPDGLSWSSGKPVTVLVSARQPEVGALPATGLIVVMRTDGDRTKCLEVPLKLVRSDGASATYAGIFYPFRAAAYDGKLRLGDETTDVSFDVRQMAGSTSAVARTSELPVGSVEEPDAFTLPADASRVAAGVFALAVTLVGIVLYRRSNRVAPAT